MRSRNSVSVCRDLLSEVQRVAHLAHIEYLDTNWTVTIPALYIRRNSTMSTTALMHLGNVVYTGTTSSLAAYLRGTLQAMHAARSARDYAVWGECLELALRTGTTATHDTTTGLYKLARDGAPLMHGNSPDSVLDYLRAFVKATA